MATAEIHARSKQHRNRVEQSKRALAAFTGVGRGYIGTSWGKDSVVVADLALRVSPRWPLVWVRVEPIANPHCSLVRDAFLRRYPSARYDEIEVSARAGNDGEWHASGTLEHGFSQAAAEHGARYASGIRAEESGVRKLRVATHGLVSANTCAPIGRWSALDVWAYTVTRGLPIHPAYAMTMGGLLDPGRVRVASLGGRRGDGMGRAEWEQRYYGWFLAELRQMLAASSPE